MNLIIILEALILGMVIFSIDFAVSRKGNEDDYNEENNSKIGSDGIVILISYLVISIFLYFFFKMEPIQNMVYARNPISNFPFMSDIIRNISKVRGFF